MWGINLAYSSGQKIIKLFENDMKNNSQIKNTINIAIVGSGSVGLMTSLILLEKGYNVTLYSKKFPF